jgi:sulfonate transport system ATP-binding protein
MSILQVRGLEFSYNEGSCVLGGVDLDVDKGEFVSVVGRSGSGKSTFLKVVCGLVSAQGGSVATLGTTRMVFQEDRLFPWLSARHNILCGSVKVGENENVRVEELLKQVRLKEKGSSYPRQLSGGERQRIALCRALIGNPDLLLLDEPFGSLDVENRANGQQILMDLIFDRQTSCVFVTHDIEEAILLSDRVAVLRNGRIENLITISFPRPRLPEFVFTEEFVELRKEISRELYI